MKVNYYEVSWKKHAFSRKMRCPNCGCKIYEVVHIEEPNYTWFIRCPKCGTEGLEGPTKLVALGRWKQL